MYDVLLLCVKPVYRPGFKFFSCLVHRGRELGRVDRIGIMLRLKAKSALVPVLGIVLTQAYAVIQMNPRVKLDPGHVGEKFHTAPAFFVFCASASAHAPAADAEIVIVASGGKLFFATLKALPQFSELGKIHICAFHR